MPMCTDENMADVSCAIEQITQTDMDYGDPVQVDASPEENTSRPDICVAIL